VAATYTYFLLYAQFGFLAEVKLALPGAQVRPVLAVMALAGIAASLLAAIWLRRTTPVAAIRLGLALCLAAALLSLGARSATALGLVAAGIGAGLGLTTVGLATLLGALANPAWLGLGTGLAYWLCNVPPLFAGSPAVKVAAVTLAVLVGLAATWRLGPLLPAAPPATHRDWSARDFAGTGAVAIVAAFTALIWFDSAAFYVIQETLSLKGETWGAPAQLWRQGAAHFAGALLAGWLLRRGWLRALLPATFALFVIAFLLLLRSASLHALAAILYAVGIAVYSVTLVAYPGRWPDAAGTWPVRWRAAAVYGVAGWLGSALGIGMAQDLHRVPPWFLALAGVLIAGGWLLGRRPSAGQLAAATGGVLALLTLVTLGAAPAPESPPPAATAIARGRAVYLAEGCLHCHSQYVRPGTADELAWGPFRPLDRSARPPLIGNRRQGPDLLNVGNRRTPTWNRLHLQQPRLFNTASRMPSYAHLFAPGESRGEDLVAYLASLGAGTTTERLNAIGAWTLPSETRPIAPAAAAKLYQATCAGCHGPTGRADGPLAPRLDRPPRPLATADYAFAPAALGPEGQRQTLARLIKFGLGDTPMAGHETLTDAQLAGLVEHLATLRAAAGGGTP
jgi:cytochrome c oxidase cbb3-type subunit 2